ncbi:hypothetical protein ACEWY4_005000 [Coilia grayii]|uniref:Gap junction protein n=1 Tax=Coilia grayii TaxID=363190 RepID=A0ABD1KHA3_9TELE
MGDWNLLGGILEEVHVHSTIVGKIWLTILFIFRMLVLGVAAEDVWVDEQSQFVCNTEQPGCKNVCYNSAFPISLIRFWVLQIVFVSSPSLVYMGHALYRLRAMDKERHRRRAQLRAELEEAEPLLEEEEHRRLEKELRRLEETKRVKKAPLRGSLLRTYVIHILTRSVVEVGFIVAQYILYGVGLDPLYKCETLPCPNAVDCYVSRPTEKTIFMVFMIVIACVSLLLNLLEISHLGVRQIKHSLAGLRPLGDSDSLGNQPHKVALQQQLCLLTNLSPQKKDSGALLQTGFAPEGHTDPPPLYLTAAVDLMPASGEAQREDSVDEGGSGEGGGGGGGGASLPVSCFPLPTRQLRLASQGRIQGLRFQMPPERPQPLALQQSISESQPQLQQHHTQPLLPHFPASEPLGEAYRRLSVLTQPTHELQRHLQANHMTAARLSMPVLPSHLAQHRPSRILDLAEARRQQEDSSDSDVSYLPHHLPHPRKASFMARLPASDSATSNLSSCPSSHSTASELGSLNHVPSSNPVPGGRRMSMASRAIRLKASDLLV